MADNHAAAAAFYDSYGRLMKAAVEPAEAVRLAGASSSGQFRAHAETWANACAAGTPLSEALRRDGMPAWDVALVGAGEAGGRVAELCVVLADAHRQFDQAHRLMRARLAYPLVLAHAVLIAPLVPWVAPQVLDGNLAALLWLGSGPALLWLTVWAVRRWWRQQDDDSRARRVRALPLVGPVVEARQVADVCLVLHAGAKAGMLADRMLLLAAEAVTDPDMARRQRIAARVLAEGRLTFAQALAAGGLPAVVVAQMAVAEKAGGIEAGLDQLALEWRMLAAERLDRAARRFSGTVYGVAVVAAAVTIIALYARYLGEVAKVAAGME
jgi:type II secretory pathway component PulF